MTANHRVPSLKRTSLQLISGPTQARSCLAACRIRRAGVRVPTTPCKRQEEEHAQDHTADQGRQSKPEQLDPEVAILGRAHVGEDPEESERREPQEWHRNQDADHSKSEHDEQENAHRPILAVRFHGVNRKMPPTAVAAAAVP
jgi:hypothetical protein